MAAVDARPLITIRRSRARYRVARDHPNPARVRHDLDMVAQGALPVALADVLAPLFASGALRGIWLIRTLHVRGALRGHWQPQQMAQQWAAQIAHSLARALEAGDDVLWFPSLGALLARLLVDLARGTAWGQWAYARFDGLRLLTTSAAVRTALLEDENEGWAALVRLAPTDLLTVLAALTAQDGRLLLERLAADPAPGAPWAALADALADLRSLPADVAGEARTALHLAVCAARSADAPPGAALGAAARALARLLRVAHAPRTRAALFGALTQGDPAALFRAAPGDGETLLPLRDAPPALLAAARALLQPAPAHPAAPASPAAEPLSTPFGGLFLLLPALVDLPLDALCTGWPALDDQTPAAALVRLLLLAKCHGGERTLRVLHDPAARRLAGIGALDADALSTWSAAIAPALRAQAHAALLAWQHARGALSSASGSSCTLLAPNGRGALLVDAARGLWLGDARAARSARTLPPGLLLHPPALAASATHIPHTQALVLGSSATDAAIAATPGAAEVAARLDRQRDDARFLAAPRGVLRPALDALLTHMAQHLLRGFGWRLPGFAWSTLPYLHANFLMLPAQVQDEAARVIVHLGKPPLHLILGMTGLTRSSLHVPWLDARPFVYFAA